MSFLFHHNFHADHAYHKKVAGSPGKGQPSSTGLRVKMGSLSTFVASTGKGGRKYWLNDRDETISVDVVTKIYSDTIPIQYNSEGNKIILQVKYGSMIYWNTHYIKRKYLRDLFD